MTNDDNDGGWSEMSPNHKVHRRIVLNLDEAWAIWWALYTFANNRPRDGWSRTRAEKILAKIEALKDALVADGTVNAGMRAKLEAGFHALAAGAAGVRIAGLGALKGKDTGTLLSLTPSMT